MSGLDVFWIASGMALLIVALGVLVHLVPPGEPWSPPEPSWFRETRYELDPTVAEDARRAIRRFKRDHERAKRAADQYRQGLIGSEDRAAPPDEGERE